MCVTNTFFKCKNIHKVSWRHPRSKHWHQLDLVLTRRSDLASVLQTRSYHSADCDPDHSLVANSITLIPKKLCHSKSKSKTRKNTYHINCSEIRQQLNTRLETALKVNTTQKVIPNAHDAFVAATEQIDATWLHLRVFSVREV